MSNNITPIAKALRKRLTDTERLLWRHLRAKQLEGLKFRRQEPIGRYIVVDFVCHEKRIVIEVDGGQHSTSPSPDPSHQGRGKYPLKMRKNLLLLSVLSTENNKKFNLSVLCGSAVNYYYYH